MMGQLGFVIIAYLDDFAACCRTKEEADRSFQGFISLTKALGLKLAEHKSSPPTTKMEWLGYHVDTNALKITIPDEKLEQLISDCKVWLKKNKASKNMIQSIAGRLIYVANAIPPARKFTARILGTLRMMKDDDWISLSGPFKADLRWFTEFAAISNGIYLFNPDRPTIAIECDSSLRGGGGVSGNTCYTWAYTQRHRRNFPNIHHLEAVNILVAYQTLATLNDVRPATVVIYTDNMASSCVLSSGKTKDETLAACSRQLWLLATTNCHDIVIKHKHGYDIPVADALSRMCHDSAKREFIETAVLEQGLTFVSPVLNDYVFFSSFI